MMRRSRVKSPNCKNLYTAFVILQCQLGRHYWIIIWTPNSKSLNVGITLISYSTCQLWMPCYWWKVKGSFPCKVENFFPLQWTTARQRRLPHAGNKYCHGQCVKQRMKEKSIQRVFKDDIQASLDTHIHCSLKIMYNTKIINNSNKKRAELKLNSVSQTVILDNVTPLKSNWEPTKHVSAQDP